MTVVFWVLSVYLLVGFVVFYAMINNIFFFRSGAYSLDFDGAIIESHNLDNPRIRYHLVRQNHATEDEKWAVIFHSWGRNSVRMESRAKIYFDRGYSILLIDAPSHGQSQWVPVVYGMDYAKYAIEICQKEQITNPLAHGLSFGSISALFFVNQYEASGLVAEALFNDFDKMYEGFFNILHIPKFLYWWIPWLILQFTLDWDTYSPKNILKQVDVPIFLIHGENDSMFPVDDHFRPNLDILEDHHDQVYSWIVEGSPHSKMARDPKFAEKIKEFVEIVEKEKWRKGLTQKG